MRSHTKATRLALTFPFLFLLAMPLLPHVGAEMGSYEEAEIIDPAGDVTHTQFYTGDRSVDSFDLLRSWIRYDDKVDAIEFTMHLVDTEEWAVADESGSLWCRETITVMAGDQSTGALHVGWRRDPGAAPTYAYAGFRREGAPADAVLPSTNSTLFARPGNLSIFVDRAALAIHGESLGQIQAVCHLESPFIAEQTGISFSSADLANATIKYDLMGLGPEGGTSGEPGGAVASAAQKPESPKPGAVPGIKTFVVFVALLAVAGMTRGLARRN